MCWILLGFWEKVQRGDISGGPEARVGMTSLRNLLQNIVTVVSIFKFREKVLERCGKVDVLPSGSYGRSLSSGSLRWCSFCHFSILVVCEKVPERCSRVDFPLRVHMEGVWALGARFDAVLCIFDFSNFAKMCQKDAPGSDQATRLQDLFVSELVSGYR